MATHADAVDKPVRMRAPNRWLGGLVLAVASALGVWAVVSQRHEVVHALASVDWWAFPIAFVAGGVGLFAIFRSWAVVVEDGGTALTLRQGLHVYGIGQVGKYIPGSVWSVVTQAQLVRGFGGSRVRMASASLVALLLSVTVALALGCALLPVSGGAAAHRFWYAPLVTAGLAVLLVPRVLNRLVEWANRVLGRAADHHTYSGGGIARAAGWALVGNLFFGLHILALGEGLGLHGLRGYLMATCAYSLAAALGVVAVLAPAGAGVREAVITAVLAPQLHLGAALTVALLSRVVTVVVDLAFGGSQIVGQRGRVPTRSPVFITRRFPPSIGGMETLAAGVWRSMTKARPDAILLAHGGSNRALIRWLPLMWLRLLWLVVRGRVESVLTGDAPTFAVVEPLLRIAHVRRATMILGLDVTYQNKTYRRLVLSPLRRADQVIAISEATRAAAVGIGVPAERVSVLRLGVVAPDVGRSDREVARANVMTRLGLPEDVLLLLTLGRLVRRKGAQWFAEKVLPGLPDNVHYVVAGDGPERDSLRAVASSPESGGRVHALGQVGDSEREDLMCGCDIFVQPNVRVPGDMEGFGLVTIEAAMRGTPVVASDLEGIKDAVISGQTGILVAPEDVDAWIVTVSDLCADRGRIRELGGRFQAAARELYGEKQMGDTLSHLMGFGGHPSA